MVVIVVVVAMGALENMVSNEELDYVSFFLWVLATFRR